MNNRQQENLSFKYFFVMPPSWAKLFLFVQLKNNLFTFFLSFSLKEQRIRSHLHGGLKNVKQFYVVVVADYSQIF